MGSETPNVRKLSAPEKIALMERLWESIVFVEDLTSPPGWHEHVLKEREREWSERDSVSQDWTEAKREIRDQLG